MYHETIPSDAPPSYRGQAVKYSYKVTIGTQRVNSPIKLLRVPFRVLVLYGMCPSQIFFSVSEGLSILYQLCATKHMGAFGKSVKLAQLVRRLLMVREVASSIPSGAVFAHVNIELA